MEDENSRELQEPFYIKDFFGDSPAILIDPNHEDWQPVESRTATHRYGYAGGTVGPADFPPGWYKRDINNLVATDKDGNLYEKYVEPEAVVDILSDATHEASAPTGPITSGLLPDTSSADSDNTTRGPVAD